MSIPGSISVVIADASVMICQLLADGLGREGFAIQRYAVTTEDLTQAVSETRPDVALIGTNLQDGRLSGYNALRTLHVSQPAVRAIMVFDSHDRELVLSAFRCGAKGVFLRTEPFEKLCKCICAVHAGQVWASSADIQALLEVFSTLAPLRPFNANALNELTKRELQIVELVRQGLTNREIAQKFCLSEHTVKNHLFRIFEKVGVSNRVELVTLHTHEAA